MTRTAGNRRTMLTRALNDAIAASGLTKREIARRCAIQPETLTDLVYGRTIPLPGTASRLAELLGQDAILTHATRMRSGKCEQCGGRFVSRATNTARRRFCSTNCQTAAHNRRGRERRHAIDRLTKNRLAMYQETVAAYCSWCEPQGVCRNAACVMRPASPLPLIALTRRSAA